ncbi:MAG: methionine synthase, partial [Planctomycetota bacterium]
DRDETADMKAVLSRMRGGVSAPVCIDTTELGVMEEAFRLYGGKPVLNSIHFEDGGAAAEARLRRARKFGAAVIALTIDEDGMARTADAKVKIAKRLHDFACGKHGLPASDLMIDPLTFTVCTGQKDDRRLAVETLDAIERIAKELPECQIVLGVSNISFGLKPEARHVLNSVFLDHAVRRGMTAAIVHFSKILPLHSIPKEEAALAEDLILDRKPDALAKFIGRFEGRSEKKRKRKKPASVEEALKLRIVDGDRKGLERDLDRAMEKHAPLEIINGILLNGMRRVGELFGAGKMQLPFVLQSAEVMKAAVKHLEPHMERVEGRHKATIVLATVKGDVHDIGKNLVDIILTNNGYRVVNLGTKQPVDAIMDAVKEHKADAVGMSGLLVKSAIVMRENLGEMKRAKIDLPVLLGGAALTKKFVEQDCAKKYERVAYARDAFEGLSLMDKVASGTFAGKKKGDTRRIRRPADTAKVRAIDWREVRERRNELARDAEVPKPPFIGSKVIEHVPIANFLPFLNERMLFNYQWGFRRGEDFEKNLDGVIRPIFRNLLEACERDRILEPRAIYGYWPCAAEKNDVILYDESGKELLRFLFARQDREGGLCIADFFRDVSSGERDVIGLQVVTMGPRASEVAQSWFESDRYRDYLFLHGLSVEMAEALAEYVHKRIRGELGFAHEDDPDPRKLLKLGYRGCRYSFGYPACPGLGQQKPLLELLQSERIGVTLSETTQLHPEQSTSAIVVHHPQAKYFAV